MSGPAPEKGNAMTDKDQNLDTLGDYELLWEYVHHKSKAAFAVLYDRYHGMIYDLCHDELADDDLAEEATQETFLKLMKDAKSLIAKRGKSERSSIAGMLFRDGRA